MEPHQTDGAQSRCARRAWLTEGFDKLPNSALVTVETLAAVGGFSEATAWSRMKSDPDAPKPIRLSPRCTRVSVGDVRAYLAKKTTPEPAEADTRRSSAALQAMFEHDAAHPHKSIADTLRELAASVDSGSSLQEALRRACMGVA